MGRNLARNFARNGYTVAVHNRTVSRTKGAGGGVRARRATSSRPRTAGSSMARPGAASAPSGRSWSRRASRRTR
ncbi:NAD(P)-binding domain-containing protein [Streptomyces tricolor]|nr:NAD(P)-binding domain-containing protein [Streptomyces tricolor]